MFFESRCNLNIDRQDNVNLMIFTTTFPEILTIVNFLSILRIIFIIYINAIHWKNNTSGEERSIKLKSQNQIVIFINCLTKSSIIA